MQDKGFQAFMCIICPVYEIPCAVTETKYICELYEEEHKKVEKLKKIKFVAITTDGGMSSNAVSFQETNVHYLDKDLNMKHHTLGVRENKKKHMANNFRKKNNELLDEFKIKENVVKTVTDNEAKMHAGEENCVEDDFFCQETRAMHSGTACR